MNTEQKKILLKVARLSIKNYLESSKLLIIKRENYPDPQLWEERGTFVTLTIYDNLRGCIGTIIPVRPLIIDVAENAVNAAFRDPRFYPLTQKEFPLIEIEVSILTVPKPLEFKNIRELFEKIRPGIDGVIIRNGPFQATFLPQVWKEIPDKETFFRDLCLKAGMSGDCFTNPSLEVYTYQVEAFSEKEFE